MIGGPGHLLRTEVVKPRSVRATLGRFAGYFKPYWYWLVVAALLLIGNAWVQVITPELLGQAVDCYLTPQTVAVAGVAEQVGQAVNAAEQNCWYDPLPADADAAMRMNGLLQLVLVLVGLFIAGSATGGAMFFLMGWTGQHVLRQLQIKLFAQLHQLSLRFYSEHETGDLMSRITNDVSTIQQAIGFALVQVLSGSLLLVWIAYNMVTTNWAYGLVSLAVLPLMVVVTVWFSSQARKAFRETRRKIGDVNAELQEGISGVREVQAFGREDANIERFTQSNAANRDANVRAVAYTSALSPALEALGYLAIAISAGVGGIFLLRGLTLGGAAVSLGLIITFLGYVQRFNQPITQISVLWTNIQSAIAGAERIFELMDETPDVVEKLEPVELPPIQGRVVYAQVGAEYKADEPVLRGVDLVAEPGQTIAIVGPTGAGKT
ncbi:MAG: ABC transporter ATP-binding protein, partial [Caldilineaceae bacterium]|nr:ABC transporter ATP-binding protein [Caldilineaceae bacterium]